MKFESVNRQGQNQLFKRLVHFPGQQVSYIQNPKVASTSFVLMLWRRHDPANSPINPHGRPHDQRPFPRTIRDFDVSLVPELLASQFFSAVRNPYHRFLSAYLNKVRHPTRWGKIARRVGFSNAEEQPSFEHFIDVVTTLDPFEIDHHFRPQHINLLNGFLPVDRLGSLENLADLSHFLQLNGFALGRDDENRTNAGSRIDEFITPRLAVRLARYYEADFLIYGYSDDIREKGQVRAPDISSDRTALRTFLESDMFIKRARASG